MPNRNLTTGSRSSALASLTKRITKIPPDAIIAHEKLTRYLLVFQPENDTARFLARGGYTQDNPGLLEAAIRRLSGENYAVFDRSDRFGDFYRVEGRWAGWRLGITGRHDRAVVIRLRT